MWPGILTRGVKEPGTKRAEFISTIGLLQNKPKKFSQEAYNDKIKGFNLMLPAENSADHCAVNIQLRGGAAEAVQRQDLLPTELGLLTTV